MFAGARVLTVMAVLGVVTISQDLNAIYMSSVLSDTIGDNLLGHRLFQNRIYESKVEVEQVDPLAVFVKIRKDLTDKINSTLSVLNRNVAQIKDDYRSGVYPTAGTVLSNFNECCRFVPTDETSSYSFKFKTWVNMMTACYRRSSPKLDNVTIPISDNFVTVARQNAEKQENSYVRWQYYGTKEGMFSKYPEHNSKNCHTYDPRQRPWYSRVFSSTPKDVLILIDRSQSMKYRLEPERRFQLAINSSIVAINNLAPYDKFGIILFSSQPNMVAGCYQHKLAVNTELNRKVAIDYLNKIKLTNETANFMKSIKPAFNVFKNINQTIIEKRNKIILFISSGKTSETINHVLDGIGDLNKELENSVLILTFGIGDLKGESLEKLKHMANQTNSNPEYGKIRRGRYQQVDEDTYENQFKTYYMNFIDDIRDDVMISEPYTDFSNLGLIITAAKAVKFDGEFMGIAGVDLKVTDLLVNMLYFNEGSHSYVFIVDSTGRTLMHPLMVSIMSTSEQEFVDISNFEFGAKISAVIDAMKRGESGDISITKRRAISLGDPKRQGIRYMDIVMRYIYGHITGTDISICVVIGIDSTIVSQVSTNYKIPNFHYHRLDLIENFEKQNLCALSNDHIGTTDYSVIKFSGWVFRDATKYFNRREEELSYYHSYFAGDAKHDNLKFGVKQLVYVSEMLDDIWKPAFMKGGVIWLYVSFVNGIFRQFPGEVISKQYDAKQRDWYKMAIAHPRQLVLTPPYEDFGNAGIVVTMSVTVHDQKKSPFVLGVMGIDFTLNKLEQVVMDINPLCNHMENLCFIVEEAGNLVYHKSFTSPGSASTFVHISEQEPEIAKDLITHGLLVIHYSIDFNTRRKYYTWSMEIGSKVDKLDNNGIRYRIEKIDNTNCYVAMVKVSSKSSNPERCANIPVNRREVEECEKNPAGLPCSSPCYISKLESYNECQNTFDSKSSQLDISIPSEPNLDYTRPEFDEPLLVERLREAGKTCMRSSCLNQYEVSNCEDVAGCSWCKSSLKADNKCMNNTQCFIIVEVEKQGNYLIVIVCAVVAVILLILIVIGLLFWRRRKSQSRVNASYANRQKSEENNYEQKQDLYDEIKKVESIDMKVSTMNAVYVKHGNVKPNYNTLNGRGDTDLHEYSELDTSQMEIKEKDTGQKGAGAAAPISAKQPPRKRTEAENPYNSPDEYSE